MRRRHFLTITSASVGGMLIYTLQREPIRVSAQSQTLKIPLRFFTAHQALDISAAAARIFPADETGPGANEAGVTIYIDRQLAGHYGKDAFRYSQGPYQSGVPEQGYQGKETPREIYRQGLAKIAGLRNLAPEEQDSRLRAIEKSMFFNLLRTHTIEGMFCDPMHGGNIDRIGWQLIGFPGPRMSYYKEVDQFHGRAFRPEPASLEQVLGRKVRPSEDED
ncbi:MAG: gluconate 2-dehydrogenase subunit 3 family protein [Bryobacteraceae bacterium]